jgi:hypothetical protein
VCVQVGSDDCGMKKWYVHRGLGIDFVVTIKGNEADARREVDDRSVAG